MKQLGLLCCFALLMVSLAGPQSLRQRLHSLQNGNLPLHREKRQSRNDCGSGGVPLTNTTGTIKSPSDPNNPDEYPNGVECTWRISAPIGERIKLSSAKKISLEGGNGCQSDYVEIQNVDTNENVIGRYCGTAFPAAGIISSGSGLLVKFISNDRRTFRGFIFDWQFVGPQVRFDDCGSTLTSSTGTFQSPQLGNRRYPNNAYCMWTIDVGDGNLAKLEFTAFNVENSLGCIYDSVCIYDGQDTNSPKLGCFCGKVIPATQFASGRYLVVEFITDDSIRKTGFSASYSVASEDEVPKEHPGCGSSLPAVLTESEGLVTSPTKTGTDNYPDNSFCQWRIEVLSGKKAHIHFTAFDVEYHRSCRRDRLEVFDGPSNADNRLGIYCGTDLPGDLTASFNVLLIQFKTDSSVTASGFNITYSAKDISDGGNGSSDDEPSCGIAEFLPKMARIVGGEEANPHSWPWQISLQYRGWHTCGGSVASKKWIITAAHCVDGRDGIPSRFTVVVGEHDMKTIEDTEQFITVQRIIKHGSYNSATLENDIALLELAADIQYTPFVRPVCFPTTDVPVDMLCTITGWGSTEGTGDQTVLNEVQVPILHRELCSQEDWYGSYFREPMICAGYAIGEKDSCQGDSGGPLVCQSNGVYLLHGLTSWGFGCAEPKKPGVYTRVAYFKDWLESQIPGKYQTGA